VKIQKVTPCLWFDGNAEEAANFYVSLLPDSRIDRVSRSPAETPSGPAGTVLVVDFTLGGTKFTGLNGGRQFPFTEAVSFPLDCTNCWPILTRIDPDARWKQYSR